MSQGKPALRAWFALLIASSAAKAIEVKAGTEDFTLHIEPLIQPRVQVDFDGPPGAAAPSGHANIDFFIQRARIVFRGSAFKQFLFGANIVALRVGERGNLTQAPFLQDAIVGYIPASEVNIDVGLLLMPLTHVAIEAAGYGSSIEAPANLLFYNNARNLREVGIQLRALLLNRRILVRGGFYEGARSANPPANPPLNPNGIPLVGGMLRLNLVGDETAYVFKGLYLDGKTRMSIGVGGQYQPHSGALRAGSDAYDDFIAVAADLFADIAVTPQMEAILAVGGYRFDYGTGNAKTGYGMEGRVGYRWGPVQPQGSFYWFNSDTKKNSYLKIAGGLNVFLYGHQAKVQAEFASIINNSNLTTTPALHQVVVQTQIAF